MSDRLLNMALEVEFLVEKLQEANKNPEQYELSYLADLIKKTQDALLRYADYKEEQGTTWIHRKGVEELIDFTKQFIE